jgi:hypothetical protein
MTKPSLFIGSSSEGLEFARAVRALLARDAEVTLWDEGFFQLGSTFIESLVNQLARFDFAVLVLTPDDLTTSRSIDALSPRDNVIFELGLFTGGLGRARTLLLYQRDARVKIPTDLAGVTAATFDWPRQDNNYQAAVGPACDMIRGVFRDLGVSEAKTAQAIEGISSRQERQEEQLSLQQAEIRSLQLALQGIVTQYELDKLNGLSAREQFMCYYSEDLYNELKHLRAMGFVRHHDGVGLTTIRQRYKGRDAQFNLKDYFYITDNGLEYLRVRRELMQDDE